MKLLETDSLLTWFSLVIITKSSCSLLFSLMVLSLSRMVSFSSCLVVSICLLRLWISLSRLPNSVLAFLRRDEITGRLSTWETPSEDNLIVNHPTRAVFFIQLVIAFSLFFPIPYLQCRKLSINHLSMPLSIRYAFHLTITFCLFSPLLYPPSSLYKFHL